MTYSSPPRGGPRRSAQRSQSSPSATPRRAYGHEDNTDITAGYTYGGIQPVEESLHRSTDARDPIVPSAQPTRSIDHYKPKTQIAILIGMGLLLIVTLAGGILINQIPAPGPTVNATPSRLPPPTPLPSDGRTGGLPFKDKDVEGYWKIVEANWEDDSLTITINIQVDEGILYYSFYAYATDDLTQHYPVEGIAEDLTAGFAGPGDTVRGTLTFNLPPQPMTLILVGIGQNQISALSIDI